MIAIIGLGNPDKQYLNTYHNMGFLALDYFAEKHNIKFTKNKFKSVYGEGNINNEKIVLLKPSTYMNLSGQAVCEIIRKLKIPVENIFVVYDDVDLPFGTVRIRKEGGAGTHNGMKSIIDKIGSNKFPRLRIGINDKYYNLSDYVLSVISKEKKDILEKDVFPKVENLIFQYIKNKDVEKCQISQRTQDLL